MFTENVKHDRRGRPSGRTVRGTETRDRLYALAIERFVKDGYEQTTLRDVARDAGVSVGLLYRYFPSKPAVLLAFYDELSGRFATQMAAATAGKWRDRVVFALRTSLDVLGPHRNALAALVPVLVGASEDGLFAPATAFSRARVQGAFEAAVSGATDAPGPELANAIGRVAYLAHLGVLLFWLLDRSPKQSATGGVVALLVKLLPVAAAATRLPGTRRLLLAADGLVRRGLFGEDDASG